MKILLKHFIRSTIYWLFSGGVPLLFSLCGDRRHLPGACLWCRLGTGRVPLPFQDGQVEVDLNSAGGTPVGLLWLP